MTPKVCRPYGCIYRVILDYTDECPRCHAELTEAPRVAAFGGRAFPDRVFVWWALDRVHAKHPGMVLVCGMCGTPDADTSRWRGADAFAVLWARDRGVIVDPFPARWEEHGKAAGPMRNRQMAQSGLVGAVAFPGGAGTAHMRSACIRAGVPVWSPVWTRCAT